MEGIFFAENPFPIMSYLPVELYVVYRAKNSINFSTDKLAGGVDYFKNFQTHIPQMTKLQIGNVCTNAEIPGHNVGFDFWKNLSCTKLCY